MTRPTSSAAPALHRARTSPLCKPQQQPRRASAAAAAFARARARFALGPGPVPSTPITDLLVQQLGRTHSTSSVLHLMAESRALARECCSESMLLLLYTAALNALARCLAPALPVTASAPVIGSSLPAVASVTASAPVLLSVPVVSHLSLVAYGRDGCGIGPALAPAPGGGELLDLQHAVRDILHELHSGRWLMSYKKVTAALDSLAVVLPALGWPPATDPRVVSDIAARLVPAATAADKLAAVPLGKLCGAFRCLKQLATDAAARGRAFPPPVLQEASKYLHSVVVGGERLAARLEQADMWALAEAVEVLAMYGVAAPPQFIGACVCRISRLVAAVLPYKLGEEVSDIGGVPRENGTSQWEHSKPPSAGAAAASATCSASGSGSAVAVSSSKKNNSNSWGRWAQARTAPSTAWSAAVGMAAVPAVMDTAELDLASLSRLLVCWCSAHPRLPRPDRPWLARAAVLVLRAQAAVAAAARLAALQEQLGGLDRQLEALLHRQAQQAKAQPLTQAQAQTLMEAATQAEKQAHPLAPALGGTWLCSARLSGSSERRLSNRGEGEAAVGPPAAAAADCLCGACSGGGGGGCCRGDWTAEEARSVLRAMGPEAVHAVKDILRAVATADLEYRRFKAQLEALGTLGRLAQQQQQPQLRQWRDEGGQHHHQQQQQHQQQQLQPHQQQRQKRQVRFQGMGDGDLVELLVRIAAARLCKGEAAAASAGRHLGSMAEAALAARIGHLEPCQVPRVLAALAGMGHTPSRQFVAEALQALHSRSHSQSPADPSDDDPQPQQPHQHQWSTAWAKAIAAATGCCYGGGRGNGGGDKGRDAAAVLVHMLVGAAAGGDDGSGVGLHEASTELICGLLRTCEQLRVPFPPERLARLKELAERRVLAALPAAALWGLSVGAKAIAADVGCGNGGDEGRNGVPVMTLAQLLHGVLLPLARLRQGFDSPELYALALCDWARRDFEGLGELTATALLNSYARSGGAWEAEAQLLQAVRLLLERALREGLRCVDPADLSALLLAASRALRVAAHCSGSRAGRLSGPAGTSILNVTDPRVAVLVLPAVEHLLDLSPSAEHISRAAQGLFVELGWRGPSSGTANAAPAAGCNQLVLPAAVEAAAAATAHTLLARMLDAAAPRLQSCSLQGYGYLLAACSVLQHRPPEPWLESLYTAATAALTGSSSSSLPAPADGGEGREDGQDEGAGLALLIMGLLDSLVRLEDNDCVQQPHPARVLALGGSVGGLGGGGVPPGSCAAATVAPLRDRTEGEGEQKGAVAARVALVTALATKMAEEAVLAALSKRPDTLALVGFRLRQLGLRPSPTWLEQYTATVRAHLGPMSLSGLAHVAEGLAAARAAPLPPPPAVFLEALSAETIQRLRSSVSLRKASTARDPCASSEGVSRGEEHAEGEGEDEGEELQPGAQQTLSAVLTAFMREPQSLQKAPSGLLCGLLQECARWGVPFPSERLAALQEVVERRVLASPPPAVPAPPSAVQLRKQQRLELLMSRRDAQGPAAASGPAAQLMEGGGCNFRDEEGINGALPVPTAEAATTAVAVMTPALLREGVLLPLARMRQGLDSPELYARALIDWSSRRFNGLDESTASILLGLFVDRPAWVAAAPELCQAIRDLLERALSLHCRNPGHMSALLLAASRALRLVADHGGMQRPEGVSVLDVTDPRVAVLVLPAVEHLLDLSPSAEHISRAAQGLFVELGWRGPQALAQGLAVTATTPAAVIPNDGMDDKPSHYGCQQQLQMQLQLQIGEIEDARMLLDFMLESAAPSLGCCPPAGLTSLLAACTALQHRPSSPWLAQLFHAAARALDNSDSDGDMLLVLLCSLAEVEEIAQQGVVGEEGEVFREMEVMINGNGSSSGHDGTDEAVMAALRCQQQQPVRSPEVYLASARGLVLNALAATLLREPAMMTWSEQPEQLVLAGRQLALLGLRPPAAWVVQYTATLQQLLGSLPLEGLAGTAEVLALLRAAPEPEFLEKLLLLANNSCCSRGCPTIGDRSRPKSPPMPPNDVDGSCHLGLLLGGAHALRQNALRKQRRRQQEQRHQHLQEQQLLSVAAEAAWEQLWEQLEERTRRGDAPADFSRPEQLVLVVAALAHRLPSVSPDWLHECAQGLLLSRGASVRYGPGGSSHTGAEAGSAGSAAPLLPAPAMLLDLLRWVSHVRDSPTDSDDVGTLAMALVVDYVHKSLLDLAWEACRDQQQQRQRPTEAVDGDSDSTPSPGAAASQDEWAELLHAARAAGIRLRPLELSLVLLTVAPGVSAAQLTATAVVASAVEPAMAGSPPAAAPPASPNPCRSRLSTWSSQESQGLLAAWPDLEFGLRQVLLPALPCTPIRALLSRLREGLLVASTPSSSACPSSSVTSLGHVSWRQLGLLCSYATQVGPDLAPRGWWQQQLLAEVGRRLVFQTPPPRAAAGSPATLSAPVSRREAAGSDGSEDGPGWGKPSIMDLASVCYGLEVNGCDVPEAALALLRRGLGALATAAAAGLVGCCGATLSAHDGQGDGGVLRALHLLWVARRCSCLASVPEDVWTAVFGTMGPDGAALAVSLLKPQQLGQLVVLRADRVRLSSASSAAATSSSSSGCSQPYPWELPVWFTAPWLKALVEKYRTQEQEQELVQELDSQSYGEGEVLHPLQRPLEPRVAALAVCYCLPSSASHESSVTRASAAALVHLALPALSSDLLLADVPAFLAALEVRGLKLPQPQMGALVARLSSSGAGARGGALLTWMAPVQAVRVVRFLVTASASIMTVLPVLSALMPAAAEGDEEPPPAPRASVSWAQPPASASPLKQQQRPLQQAQPNPSTAGTATWHLAMEELPPGELAALASALIDSTIPTTTTITSSATTTTTTTASGCREGVDEGGPLPRLAAVVLLRLLSLEAVVHLVPTPHLERALRCSLVGTGLPLPDAVHAGLLARLHVSCRQQQPQSCRQQQQHGMDLGELLCCLRRCGTSEAQNRRALLLSLADADSVGRLGVAAYLAVLRELADSGVRAHAEIALRYRLGIPAKRYGGSSGGAAADMHSIDYRYTPRRGGAVAEEPAPSAWPAAAAVGCKGRDAPGPAAGPYAGLAVRLVRHLARLVQQQDVAPSGPGPSLSPVLGPGLGLGEAAEALHLLAVLLRRLDGLGCGEVWRVIYQISSEVACQRDIAQQVQRQSAALFRFLEAALELGGLHQAEMAYRSVCRSDHLHLVVEALLPGEPRRAAAWAAELARDSWAAARAQRQTKLRSELQREQPGSYLLSPPAVRSLAQAIRPILEAHLAAVEEEGQQMAVDAQRDAMVPAGGAGWRLPTGEEEGGEGNPHGVDAEAAVNGGDDDGCCVVGSGSDPRRLTPRQMGLLFGLLFFQSQSPPHPDQQLAIKIHVSLCSLVSREAERGGQQGLTPLEHLTAVLDALEPIHQDTGGLHPNCDQLFQISRLLAAPLLRVLSGAEVGEDGEGGYGEHLPKGLDPWADAVLLRSPVEISEEALLEALRRPQPGDAVSAAVAALAAPRGPGVPVPVVSCPSALPLAAAAVSAAPLSPPAAATGQQKPPSGSPGRPLKGGGAAGAVVVAVQGSPPTSVTTDVDGVTCLPCIRLPTVLRPPPGRRHGMPGDLRGDAAREAYVRSVAPWLVAGRRLVRLLHATRQEAALAAALEARGLQRVGRGRWATSLGLLVVPERTAAAMVQRGTVSAAQAQALVQILRPAGVPAPLQVAAVVGGHGGALSLQVANRGLPVTPSTHSSLEASEGSTAPEPQQLSQHKLSSGVHGDGGIGSIGGPGTAAAMVERAAAAGLLPPCLDSCDGRLRLRTALAALVGVLEARPGGGRLATVRALAALMAERVPAGAANSAAQQVRELRARMRSGGLSMERARVLTLTNLAALIGAAAAEEGEGKCGK
ncbi:hypothetical protein PLESTM_001140800 [Pleodorina starrii]|nr:hypothetical protein PLESTM_001140800 [Pleodorina starrii]